MTTLQDKWFNQVCQLDLTKVKCFLESMMTCFLIQIKWLTFSSLVCFDQVYTRLAQAQG